MCMNSVLGHITTLLFIVLTSLSLQAQYKISGRILVDSIPVEAATVVLINTPKGTISDIDGYFQIDNISAGTYTIEVQYIGAQSIQQLISVNKDLSGIVFNLKEENAVLNQVMITSKSKRLQQELKSIPIKSINIQRLNTSIKDITSALGQVSGVRVRSSGTIGGNADISINGLNGSAVRTYIDGFPMEFLYPSSNLSSLPMHNIQRIDVYKGVLPIQIGTDAMGGGVHIIRKNPKYDELTISQLLGSYKTYQSSLSFSKRLGKNIFIQGNGNYSTSANDFEFDAYIWEQKKVTTTRRFHDDFKMKYGELGILVKEHSWADKFRASMSYTGFDKALQHGAKITKIALGNVHYNGTNINGIVQHEKQINSAISLNNSLAYGEETMYYIDTSANRYSWSGKVIARLSPGEFNGASNSKRIQHNFIHRAGVQTTLHPNWELDISNVFANQILHGRDEVKPVERDILQKKQTLRKNVSGVELRYTTWANRWISSIAMKWYNYALLAVDFKSFSPLSQRDDATGYYLTSRFQINDNLLLRASYEKAYRIPSYVQFFGNGVNIIPNSILRPESSNNFNLGFVYRNSSQDWLDYHFEVNSFLRNQADIIFLNQNVKSRYINAEGVRSYGIELESNIRFWDILSLRSNLTLLNKAYTSIGKVNKTSQFLVGTPFPNTPKRFANIGLTIRQKPIPKSNNTLLFTIQYRYVDSYNYINVGKIKNLENWIPTQHNFDLNLSYNAANNRYRIVFNVFNLFDKAIFDHYKLPRPGRNYNLKLIYTLKKINN